MKQLAIAWLLLAACGDDGTSHPDAAPNVDAAIDAPVPTNEGQVFLTRVHEPERSLAIAMFVQGKLVTPTMSAGGCYTAPNMPATSVSAGTLSISGTLAGTVALAQDNPGDPYTADDVVFAPGAELGVVASGAMVPAFTGTVKAPMALPAVAFPATIDRAAGATMTWAAGDGDRMMILVVGLSGASAMLCEVPDSGTFTFTPAALALLATAETEVLITAYRLRETIATAGPWKVYLRAADGLGSEAIAID